MSKEKQFVVFGLGVFGQSVALTLSEMGFEVLGVDIDSDVVQDLSEKLTYVVATDAMDESALRELGIGNFDAAVVSVGDFGASLMCTLLCREMGVKRIIVKARDEHHGKMAERIGADEVIYSEKYMGRRIARNLASENVMDYIELAENISLITVKVPPDAIGKNLVESNFRQLYDVTVVAIRRNGVLMMNPSPQTIMNFDDELLIIGADEAVKRFSDLIVEND